VAVECTCDFCLLLFCTVFFYLLFCTDAGEFLQENWQKLIDLQHMLTAVDNVVVADRVCTACLKYFA